MIEKYKSKTVITIVLLALSSNLLASTLSIRDWTLIGDGGLTYDSSTNLEWLDLTETLGESVISVDSQLGTGGAYEGFRYATETEVTQLFTDFDIYSQPNDDAQVLKIDELALIMGQTVFSDGGSKGFAGANNPGEFNRGMWLMNMHYYQDICCGGVTLWEIEDFGYDPVVTPASFVTNGHSEVGSYLVRQSISAVPLPAAVWLFGSGILCLMGIAIKKRS